MRYVGIIGNNSTKSTNRTLMNYVAKHFNNRADFDIREIRPLPPFIPDEQALAPAAVQELIDAITASDGVIIATPEYNHTVPAALKNALDWLSWTSDALRAMPVMIIGASYGRLGTSRAQLHLREILISPRLRSRVLASQFMLSNSLQAFDEHGNLVREQDISALETHFGEYETFSQIIKEVNEKEKS